MGFVIVDAPRNDNERARYWRSKGGWGLRVSGWATVWPSVEDAETEVKIRQIGYANIRIHPVDN